MTTTEAAAMLGVGRAAVQRACQRRTMKASKRNGKWWITRGQLRAYQLKYWRKMELWRPENAVARRLLVGD